MSQLHQTKAASHGWLIELAKEEVVNSTMAFFAPVIGARIVLRDLLKKRRELGRAPRPLRQMVREEVMDAIVAFFSPFIGGWVVVRGLVAKNHAAERAFAERQAHHRS